VNSQAGAAGVGFGVYALFATLGLLPAASRYTPVGLLGIPARIALGEHPALVWPLVTALVLAAALVAGAAWLLRRQEL
jgi:hypothetical protein